MPLGELLEDHDAAFVGTLVERPPDSAVTSDRARHVFAVEAWVKGDLGPEVVVHAPYQTSACGFGEALGVRTGVLLRIRGGVALGNSCATANPAALVATVDLADIIFVTVTTSQEVVTSEALVAAAEVDTGSGWPTTVGVFVGVVTLIATIWYRRRSKGTAAGSDRSTTNLIR